jgi:TonB family protein
MPKLIINLAVALLTFVMGTLASALFYVVSPSAESARGQAFVTKTRAVLVSESETLSNGGGCRHDYVTGESGGIPSVADQSRAPISGGILNGKALSLPKPQDPAIAKAAHASGTVTVQVVIDERGYVESARAVGGHPLLQSAAVEAAYQASFTPTRLAGQPVKVTGVITYNFVPQ